MNENENQVVENVASVTEVASQIVVNEVPDTAKNKEEVVVAKNNNKMFIFIIVFILLLIVGAVYYFIFYKKDSKPVVESGPRVVDVIDDKEEYGTMIDIDIKEMEVPKADKSLSSRQYQMDGINWVFEYKDEDTIINLHTDDVVNGEVVIPSEIDGLKVLSVGAYDFHAKNSVFTKDASHVTSVSIGEGVEYLNAFAFYDMRELLTVKLPDSIKYIGESSFAFDRNLSTINSSTPGEVILPKDLEYYGKYLFRASKKISSFEFPEKINYIREYTFYECSGFEGTLNIPGHIEYILEGAFRDAGRIKVLNVSDGLKYITGFEYQKDLVEVNLPKSVIAIGTGAFLNDYNITIFSYRGNLEYLGKEVFAQTSIKMSKFIQGAQIILKDN